MQDDQQRSQINETMALFQRIREGSATDRENTLEYLHQRANSSPDMIQNSEDWNIYALGLRAAGRLEEAIEIYDRLVYVLPDKVIYRHNLASLYMETQQFDLYKYHYQYLVDHGTSEQTRLWGQKGLEALENFLTSRKAVEALIAAQTWHEKKRVIEAQRALLLTNAVDPIFAKLLEQFKTDANTIRLLQANRDLLARCQTDGIEATFARYRLSELQTLQAEINRLTDPLEMPRKVELCRAALRLINRDTEPELWGDFQSHLANNLFENSYGERADNLEQAIFHYDQIFEVWTRQASPKHWAITHSNLVQVYSHRVRGERADNLEQALFHSEQALEVYTRQAFPGDWAATQHNLALFYRDRVRGERADNLEQALFHCGQALEVYTRQDFDERWAAAHNNLGIAYRSRIRGERADNVEKAIFHCEQALEVRTRQAFPEDWAASNTHLASAYVSRVHGEQIDNLERAIFHYEQALEVYTRQAFPDQWASTCDILAIAYRDRVRGEPADSLEQALFHCEQALEVHTRQAFPEGWAEAQYILAVIYNNRIQGTHADNLDQAIFHYEQALEMQTPTTFPKICRDTAYALGSLLYDKRRFTEARRALDTAHLAVEASRGEMQRETTKRALAEENADLYAHLVSCCLREVMKPLPSATLPQRRDAPSSTDSLPPASILLLLR